MQIIRYIFACLFLLIFVVGCVQEQPKVQEPSPPDVLALKRKNVKLRRANEDLQRENIVLKDRVATLTDRERKLSKKLADQEFELGQLRQQVDSLADLPAERDRYKKQAEKLKADVIRLELELRQYKRSSSPAEETPAKSEKEQ
ncbi:MAG: hypothetical protein JW849_11740 [Phycisphaerae bacterium]|nr:hypothetical protein [Phycisphaerae bacterium]